MSLTPSQSLTIGITASPFSLPDTRNGDTVSLEHYLTKPVLVAFICNHCPYVVHLMDSFIACAHQLARQDIATIAISANDASTYPADSPENMRTQMETTLANNASSKGKPLISIIMPVRDWRSTKARAAISILEQSYQPLELLLIGQADTQELARQLQQARLHDARIRILGRQAPGIVGALNTGLAAARGEYIGRMDDDDIAYPTRLASQLDYAMLTG